jgi:hypothetical protein
LQELEFALAGAAVLLDDLGAGDVRRHEVGSELDAAEGQGQRARQRADHERLGQAGHAFEDTVALAEERDEQLLDDLILADDDAAQLLLDIFKRLAQAADGVEVVLCHVGRGRSLFVHAFLFFKTVGS